LRYLLDTNFISDIIKPVPNRSVVEWVRSADQTSLCVSVITFGELRRGVELLDQGRRKRALDAWISNDLSEWFGDRVLAVDRVVAEQYGRLGAESKRRGWGLESADALIAATAQVHDLVLATLNRKHFAKLGVKLLQL
jgi:predicted nucleic acid-binding protein